MSFDPTQQPPPFGPEIQDQAYTPHSGHGSVGPVIGVLAVIMVLCAIAVMIGRLCSGRRVMGHLQYDFEGWVETKCSSCIDGRIGPPPRRVPVPVVVVESGGSNVSSNEAAAAAGTAESPEMAAEEAAASHLEEESKHREAEGHHGKHENGDGS